MIRGVAAALAVAGALATPGTLDQSFGHGGSAATYLSKVSLGLPQLAPGPAGGIVLLGEGRLAGEPLLVRYDADGHLVRSFARGGVVRQSGFVGLLGWGAARPLPGGDVLALGEQSENIFENDVLVARFLPDGRLDPAFGLRGRLRQRFGPMGCTESWPVAAVPVGAKTVVVSRSCSQGGGRIVGAVARLTSAGRIDRGFAITSLAPIHGNSVPDSLGRQRDGKILVGLSGERDAAVARLLRNGRPDPTFDKHGYTAFHRGPEIELQPLSGVFELSDASLLAVACINQQSPVFYRLSSRGRIVGSTIVEQVAGCLRSPVQIGDDLVGAADGTVVRLAADGTVVWTAPFSGVTSVLLQRGRRIVAAAPVHLGPGRYGYELRRYAG